MKSGSKKWEMAKQDTHKIWINEAKQDTHTGKTGHPYNLDQKMGVLISLYFFSLFLFMQTGEAGHRQSRMAIGKAGWP